MYNRQQAPLRQRVEIKRPHAIDATVVPNCVLDGVEKTVKADLHTGRQGAQQ